MSDGEREMRESGHGQMPSPMAFACFYLITNLVERLMAKGLFDPEDLRAICAQAAGAAADQAVALSESTDSTDRALRAVLEEAGQLAATMFRAGQ